MFWSGNYIAVRELNFLLKEENVSLTQVLEADDILQECKADNKALIQFLTKPEVLAELITLITEEPPKNVELTSQYRHASIACEVLTSQLSTLADRLSLDTVQMNRLCDFINKEPPLNPLLASYFSKTVEMLLERSPKQDWYLYHIVCLRVLDFFRSRRDFLPNLLRHVATSAIADTFKALLRLDDLFNKLVMEWLDEHQFLESLIAIICGSYVPEPVRPAAAPAPQDGTAPQDGAAPDARADAEKADAEISEKTDVNHKEEDGKEEKPVENSITPEGKSITINTRDSDDGESDVASARWRAVAAANAASLLCDLVLNGCAGDHCTARLRTVWVLVSRLQSEEWVRALLGGMFTSPASARPQALVHGCQVLLALLSTDPILAGQCAAERTSVELAVAPHLPLLHQTLLQDYTANRTSNDHDGGGGGGSDGTAKPRVGAARVHVAALLAQLALSEVEDVPTTMITLGTPGTLVDLFFRFPDNNFLHAQVHAFIKHALANRAYRTHYAKHLLVECDLLNRLMDVFEENENKRAGVPRAGYMGHVILALRRVARALSDDDEELLQQLRLPDTTAARWAHFVQHQLLYAAQQHDTPLGDYPSENIYEVDNMAELGVEASYEFNDISGNDLGDDIHIDAARDFGETSEGGDGGQQSSEGMASNAKRERENAFLELAGQRFDDDMWDDSPEDDAEEEPRGFAGAGPGAGPGAGVVPAHDVEDVLSAVAPWETPSADGGFATDDDWAQFNAAPAPPPIDPFAPLTPLNGPSDLTQEFTPFWPSSNDTSDIPDAIMQLSKFSISDTFPEEINEPGNPVEKLGNPIEVSENLVEQLRNTIEVSNNPVEKPSNLIDERNNPVGHPSNPIDERNNPVEHPSNPIENPCNPIELPRTLVEKPSNPIENPSNPVGKLSNPIELPNNPVQKVEGSSNQAKEVKLDNAFKDVDNRQIDVQNSEVNVNNIDKEPSVNANKLDVDNDNIKTDTADTVKCETTAIEVNEACSDS